MLWWICVIYCFPAINSWDSELNSCLSGCLWDSVFAYVSRITFYLICWFHFNSEKENILYSWIFDVTCNNIDGIKLLFLLHSQISDKSKFTCAFVFKSKNVSQPPFAASNFIHMTFVRFSLIFLFYCVSIVNRRACIEGKQGKDIEKSSNQHWRFLHWHLNARMERRKIL